MSIFIKFVAGEYWVTTTVRVRSDQVKATFYHEYAHVSHYSVGSDDYWRDNIEYVVNNDKTNNNSPYGTATTPGAGRTAVIEMWGEHYGKTLADRQYDLAHSNSASTNMNTRIRRRYLYDLELFMPNGTGFPGVVDNTDSWIPYGVLHDCLDDNALNPSNVIEPAVVMDGVKDYTQASFFNSITNAQNIMTVRDNLTSTLPTGQTAAAVTTLFLSYGY